MLIGETKESGMSVVPSYLESMVLEGKGDPEIVKNELLLCHIKATEEQTRAIERLSALLSESGEG